MKGRSGIAICLLVMASSCGPARQTVGDGTFQKRKLRPGWHLDLGLRQHDQIAARERLPEPRMPRLPDPIVGERELLATAGSSMIVHVPQPELVRIRPVPRTVANPVHSARTVQQEPLRGPSVEDPPARWNPWAVPAFVVALGTVAYAILGTSELVVVIAVIATLVLASIAVRKGRMNKWSGKGFAIAALMIGALAGLITMIALIAG